MSQLAIWIGRSFIELSRKTGAETRNKRVSYSINSMAANLKSALTGFAEEGDHVTMEWQLPYVTVERQLGSATAFLTTAGTEHWLELNLPLVPNHWSTQIEYAPMPLSRDLCFGVAERMSPHGKVLRSPDPADLDFLVEKLRMNKITHVAVGFLHANKNPENEQKVVQHFREKGFVVSASHEWDANFEERPRFWSAVIESYVDSFLTEKRQEIETVLNDLGITTQKLPGENHKWFKAMPFLQFSQATVYCGPDEMLWYMPNQNPVWKSTFGVLAAPGLGAEKITPHPLQLVDRNFWKSLAWSDSSVDWDLGPMCFGKGLKPTLLDLFHATGKLVPTPGLAERLSDKNSKKIMDTLRAYTRVDGGHRNENDILDGLLRTVAENWRLQMPHVGTIQLVGPLAPTILNIFKHVGLDHGITLANEDFYISENILRLVSQ